MVVRAGRTECQGTSGKEIEVCCSEDAVGEREEGRGCCWSFRVSEQHLMTDGGMRPNWHMLARWARRLLLWPS